MTKEVLIKPYKFTTRQARDHFLNELKKYWSMRAIYIPEDKDNQFLINTLPRISGRSFNERKNVSEN